MSLINDALKRARETQPKSDAPSSSPAMRPVDAARPERRPDFLLPLLVVVILLLALVLFSLWWRGGLGVVTVRAKSLPETVQPVQVIAQPAPVTPSLSASVNGTDMTNATDAKLEATATNAALTNVVAVVEPPKPPPITYKLQSVFYRPGSPAAVINGKLVYRGDRIGDAHVVAIGPESATIVTASGETNLLELP
jgi:cytoskeletal protein RodZ